MNRFAHRLATRSFALTVAVASVVTAAAISRSAHAAAPATLKFCSDIQFSKCGSKLTPSQDIYIRAEFGSPVGEVFQQAFGLDSIPLSGKFAFAIAKNIDDEHAIIEYVGPMMVSRYSKQNTFDLTLQASEKQVERIAASGEDIEKAIPFNSIGTMGTTGLSASWANKAVMFPVGDAAWEAFLVFVPANGDAEPKLVAQGKFTYAMTAAGRGKLVDAMNFYDKQRFEKTPDDGVTTAVHKANLEKITFARTKMVKGFDDASALTGSIKGLASGVYARLYMKQSVRNALADVGQGKDVSDVYYQLHVVVDGKTERWIDDKISQKEAMTLTSWSLTLVPGNAADGEDMPNISRKFVYLMSMLEPGKHKVAISAQVGSADQVVQLSSGELEVDIVAKDRDAVAKKWGQQLPGRGLLDKDKKLGGELKKMLAKDIVAIRAPNSWEVRKNAFDMVTHRVTQIQIGYKDKGECRLGITMIQQDVQGKGFGPTHLSTEKAWFGVDGDLPCQNLVK